VPNYQWSPSGMGNHHNNTRQLTNKLDLRKRLTAPYGQLPQNSLSHGGILNAQTRKTFYSRAKRIYDALDDFIIPNEGQ
jgi:hypothetical protein